MNKYLSGNNFIYLNSFLWVILFFVSVSCSINDFEDVSLIASDGCIWEGAPHCAFTDIVEYDGVLYCCFREGNSHVPSSKSDNGKIRVIFSRDGESWNDFGLISEPEYDLRDPKICVTPDNRLMIMYGRSNNPNTLYPWTIVKFITQNEINNSKIENSNKFEISIDGNQVLSHYWLWRIKWINNEAYGVAYELGKHPILVKSHDGINYSIVTVLNIDGSEADIEFTVDGKIVIILRCEGNAHNGYIGYSKLDSLNIWNWTYLNNWIHCPKIISLDDYVIVAGRGEGGTNIFLIKDKGIYPIVSFEGEGDRAYPGMIIKDGDLIISYYNQIGNNTKIFLKKLSLENIIETIKRLDIEN